MVELTERFLSDVGGWQALQQARSINRSGRVAEPSYAPPFLRGRVREGDTEYQAGLEIRSKSEVENLCRCRESQRWGKICAHSLAVGMAILKPIAISSPPVEAPSSSPEKPPVKRARDFQIAPAPDTTLHVVMPPNLANAWRQGQVTVGIEAVHAGRRVMIGALKTGAYTVDERDHRLVDAWRVFNGGQVAGCLSLSQVESLGLWAALADHPRVTLGREIPLTIRTETPVLVGQELPDGGLELAVKRPPHEVLFTNPAGVWAFSPGALIQLSKGVPAAYLSVFENPVRLDEAAARSFRQTELPALARIFHIEGIDPARPLEITADDIAERPEFQLHLEGSLNHLAARLTASYRQGRFSLDATAPADSRRNGSAEASALHRLRLAGFSPPDQRGQLTLRTERNILRFFASVLPKLEKDWTVKFGDRFRNLTSKVERVSPRLEVSRTGADWFEMTMAFEGGDGDRIPPDEIQRLLRSGQSHFRGKSGRISVLDADLLEDFAQVVAECQPEQPSPGVYRVPQRQAGYLAETLRESPGWQLSGDELQPAPPALERAAIGDLRTVLRDYQWEGVRALQARASMLGGAILADEMGLGKTLQALALIRAERARGGTTLPALVVGPSSLVFNWEREAGKFTPELSVVAVHGADRGQALREMAAADLILTSYPILQRDLDRFSAVDFGSVFLDEAQHIKNPDTQNAKAAMTLRARHRFVLTGTPMENSIRDIWSLMEFISPGYLGRRQDFRDSYELPVQKDPGGPELARFQRRIRPFLIRRTKRDVLSELPEKTSQIVYYEMAMTQQQLYRDLLSKGRDIIAALRSGAKEASARMTALNLLLRLRQACCDPQLVNAEFRGSPTDRSGKFEAFRELMNEAIDGGHRILVFSQFVRVLEQLKIILSGEEIGFCYLDGSTKDRATQVDRFQVTNGPPIFLISLKAGGSGLNLTAADTVIHIDPWWNPAVEDQATDRVHRIGQKRPVTAYKLIARHTVEEKILALQKRKRAVADAVVESEEPVMAGLTDDDLRELLT